MTAAYAGAFTSVGLNNVNKQKQRELAQLINRLKEGAKYELETKENELNGQLIPTGSVVAFYLGKIIINEEPYFIVEKELDSAKYNIAVNKLISIKPNEA